MNVSKLDGALLDFWVAKSEGLKLMPKQPDEGDAFEPGSGHWHPSIFHPSSDWSQGGAIIANDWYHIEDALIDWFGPGWAFVKAVTDNPLKWFLRAYVKSKFGDKLEEVEHPVPVTTTEHEYQPAAGARRWPSWLSRERGRQSSDMGL